MAERVKAVIGLNQQSGHLFVFGSRRGDRLGILVWDRDGFVLWYRRSRNWSVQTAAGGARGTIGRVACQRVGHDSGWD